MSLTPLQKYQHYFSDALQAAARNLDTREQAVLAHYIHMRTSIELSPHLSRKETA